MPGLKPAYLISGDDDAKIDAWRARVRRRAEEENGPGGLETFTAPADPPQAVATGPRPPARAGADPPPPAPLPPGRRPLPPRGQRRGLEGRRARAARARARGD